MDNQDDYIEYELEEDDPDELVELEDEEQDHSDYSDHRAHSPKRRQDARHSDSEEDEDADEIVVRERQVRKDAIALAKDAESKKLQTQANFVRTTYDDTIEKIQIYENLYAQAIDCANGAEASACMKELSELKERKKQCQDAWTGLEIQYADLAKINPHKADSKTIDLATEFANKINFKSLPLAVQNEMIAIDNQMVGQRRSDTKAYWKEFAKKTAHLYEPYQQNTGATMNTRNTSRATTHSSQVVPKGAIKVSRERKEALIEAGVWDNPTLRNKYLRQYQKWDRENAGGSRSYDIGNGGY